MGAYLVTAPYVTLKVKDFNGVTIVQGYYAGGIVQDPIEDAQFEKHVNGWIEDAPAPEALAADEPEEPQDEAPKGNASRDVWAAYAKDKKGAPDEETRPVEDGGLSQTALREKYGN
jgi:hypothetical protein